MKRHYHHGDGGRIRRLLFVGCIVVSQCQGRTVLPAAAIFGGFFGNDKKEDVPVVRPLPSRGARDPVMDRRQRPYPTSYQQQTLPRKLNDRPPPPPLPSGGHSSQQTPEQKPRDVDQRYPDRPSQHEDTAERDETEVEVPHVLATENRSVTLQQNPPPPPPPPPPQPHLWERSGGYVPYAGLPPPPGWAGPPPQGMWPPEPYQNWMAQEQQYYNEDMRENEPDGLGQEDMYELRRELEDSISRQHELMGQIQNLTASLASLEQREDLHMRQLDVLTERVMDVETEAASERNSALEYRANCTALGRSLAVLQDELQDWKDRCANLTEQHERDEERMDELNAMLKERNAEVEELAVNIETRRLHFERERYIMERKKRKSGGFLSWLFGIRRDDSDDDEERLQELAKSTLLRALQTERNSVHELEAVLSTLQQNNSAISEMVESRDMLINELNDRVAVFEEDKLVLKAALRQLQKEMKDEAPKTQKLMTDLRNANEEINNLKAEVQSMLTTHQEELILLQSIIMQKQVAINETESNLTVIGTYVDKLEERLASFAIARRDIEIREQKCNEIEHRAVEIERERDELKRKVEEFTEEHGEIKKLLADLVEERSVLQNEKVSLLDEKEKLLQREYELRETIAALEGDRVALSRTLEEWESKVVELELQLEELAMKPAAIEERNDAFSDDLTESESEDADVPAEASPLLSGSVTHADIGNDEEMKVEPTSASSAIGMDLPQIPNEPNAEELATVTDKMEDTSEPNLPGGYANGHAGGLEVPLAQPEINPNAGNLSRENGNSPQGIPPQPRRNVPFRQVRKAFARATGMHGLFTPPSRRRPPPLTNGRSPGTPRSPETTKR